MSREHDEGTPTVPADVPTDPADGAPDLAGPEVAEAPGRSRSRISIRRVAVGVAGLLAVVAATAALQPATFYKMSPGPSPDVTASVAGDIRNPAFTGHGRFYFTTVKVSELNWWEYLRLRVHPEKGTTIVPGSSETAESKAAATAAAAQLMRESKQIAWHVASAKVTGAGATDGVGARVLTVTPGSAAAAALLKPGDVIVSVDGKSVTSAEALPGMVAVAARTAPLTVRRFGAAQELRVTFDVVDGKQRLGVQLGTALPEGQSPALDVRTEGVGGPSGGLMFTLAFTDALASGDLTAGKRVAGTGTIALDGTVGAIGGVEDKVIGAQHVGATVFFTPKANAAAAVAAAPAGMAVVPVATYDDAVAWLCAHGATSTVCTR